MKKSATTIETDQVNISITATDGNVIVNISAGAPEVPPEGPPDEIPPEEIPPGEIPADAFPGQPDAEGRPLFPVGFEAAPTVEAGPNIVIGGTPGNPTRWPGGGFKSNTTYCYFDFDPGPGPDSTPIYVTSDGTYYGQKLDGVLLVGCRVQSNMTAGLATAILGGPPSNGPEAWSKNVRFQFCTVCPRVAIQPTVPVPGAWPTAGVGTQTLYTDADARRYTVPVDKAYQFCFGAFADGFVAECCDMWGFGNVMECSGGSGTFESCWMHDCAQGTDIPPTQSTNFHTDGPGSLSGMWSASNIIVNRCTIALLGNTQCIAFQDAQYPYSYVTVTNNYLSGDGYTVDMCHNVSGNNHLTFSGNILSDDIKPLWGLLYANFSAQFTDSTNKWRNNKLKANHGGNGIPGFKDGYYLLPDASFSATDWTG